MKSNWTLKNETIGRVEACEVDPKGWDYKTVDVFDGELLIADVRGYTTGQFAHPDTVAYNSALIVKAPEMLSAINEVIEAWHNRQMNYRLVEKLENIINSLPEPVGF